MYNCRYIQGARFFGNSYVDVDSVVPVNSDQPISEVAVMNNETNSTSVSTAFRARLVGQGYKQVTSMISAPHPYFKKLKNRMLSKEF